MPQGDGKWRDPLRGKPPAKTGFPTKFTKNTTTVVLEAARAGMWRSHAAELAGISPRTLSNWLERGEVEDEEGNPRFPEFAEFRKEYALAEAEDVQNRLSRMTHAAQNGQWQADAWVLERKYPDKFAKPERIAVQHEGNQTITLKWE